MFTNATKWKCFVNCKPQFTRMGSIYTPNTESKTPPTAHTEPCYHHHLLLAKFNSVSSAEIFHQYGPNTELPLWSCKGSPSPAAGFPPNPCTIWPSWFLSGTPSVGGGASVASQGTALSSLGNSLAPSRAPFTVTPVTAEDFLAGFLPAQHQSASLQAQHCSSSVNAAFKKLNLSAPLCSQLANVALLPTSPIHSSSVLH